MKVLKFGGTSMATPESIKSAARIILDEKEAAVVVSAPGKRSKSDVKITDLLFASYKARLLNGRCDTAFKEVEERFLELAKGLGVDGLKPYLEQIVHDINSGASLGYTVSRGEFLSALLLRHLVSCQFMDAAEVIKFDIYGRPALDASYESLRNRLRGCTRAIIPGYYGGMPNGEIKTFTRGGSDITGAIVAAALDAEVYENWTDVDGVYFCPLTHICGPVKRLTYREMRELSFFGATVLHPDCLLPLMPKGIPVVIKNTFNPKSAGTFICDEGCKYGDCLFRERGECKGSEYEAYSGYEKDTKPLVSAIAGRGGFTVFTVYKEGSMEQGYLRDVIAAAEKQGSPVFTVLCGVDSYSVVLNGELPEGFAYTPCSVSKSALITILGDKDFIIRELTGLDLNFDLIQGGAGGMGVIIGVEEPKLESAITCLCRHFYKQ